VDLLLTSAEELLGKVKSGGSLGCSDQVLVEFMISRDKERLDEMYSQDSKPWESKPSVV